MALNMYARYIAVGRITNQGKNEYFVFDDRKEAIKAYQEYISQ